MTMHSTNTGTEPTAVTASGRFAVPHRDGGDWDGE